MSEIPFTPRMKTILALASKEAQARNHGYVGSEHLVCAMFRVASGLGHRMLVGSGAEEARALEIFQDWLDPQKKLRDEITALKERIRELEVKP